VPKALLQRALEGIEGGACCPMQVAKMAGSLMAVAGGLAVGKEGPFVHAGAAVGALLSQVRVRQYRMCVSDMTGCVAACLQDCAQCPCGVVVSCRKEDDRLS